MLETERLRLRAWRVSDRDPFVAMNLDPEVMRWFPSTMSAEETDAFRVRINAHIESAGFGLWAVEVRETGDFAGYIGLMIPSFQAHFTPCVEIGWRLARRFWHRGLATEGAAAVMQFAFEELGLPELVSMTATANLASRRVMVKLGMERNPAEDFDHPRVAEGHPLRRHVLYRKMRH